MTQHVCWVSEDSFQVLLQPTPMFRYCSRILCLLPQRTAYWRLSGFLASGWFSCLCSASCLRNTRITDACNHIKLLTCQGWEWGRQVFEQVLSHLSSPYIKCCCMFSLSEVLGESAGRCNFWFASVHSLCVCQHSSIASRLTKYVQILSHASSSKCLMFCNSIGSLYRCLYANEHR